LAFASCTQNQIWLSQNHLGAKLLQRMTSSYWSSCCIADAVLTAVIVWLTLPAPQIDLNGTGITDEGIQALCGKLRTDPHFWPSIASIEVVQEPR
jgi:hypothetical protein